MAAPDLLRTKLAALGISDTSRIVVYFAKDWLTPATRVVFTLDYAGLKNVSMLDGGVDAWTRGGHELSTAGTSSKAGRLSPLETRPIVVDAEFVKAHLNTPGFSIVDGRVSAFFDGVQTGGGSEHRHRTGHIAGARSVPFNSVVDNTLSLRPADELAALFAKAGVKPGDTIVGYCHLGQQATAMLFAARSLGYNVLLYDGSFEDWSRHVEYPVDNPSAKQE
jgi:thiosulfate/3-mercaptopyruvate sulfurtransferase